MDERKGNSDEHNIIIYKDLLPLLPNSTSIWGEEDILNSQESSQETLKRVMLLARNTGVKDGIYVSMRQAMTIGEYRLPLKMFDVDPGEIKDMSLDDMVTFISGPLSFNEAIAAGYLLETALVAKHILDGGLELEKSNSNLWFEQIVERTQGMARFIPLGVITLYDYIARMAHYRNIRHDLKGMDMSEENFDDLSEVVGAGIVPLAHAFKKDEYKIGDNFQKAIEAFYVGNINLFIPYAGEEQPKNDGDWQLIGLGLQTGVRLFRKIEKCYLNQDEDGE